MPQSLANVLLHIVFSTKDRYPFLVDNRVRSEMHAYLGGTCNSLGCAVITVGGVADHVHILCRLSRKISIAHLLEEIKRGSSKWVKTKGGIVAKFAWQNGYGVFSVGQSDAGRVRKYIKEQDQHHRKKTFQEEILTVLSEHEVEFDERYLWD